MLAGTDTLHARRKRWRDLRRQTLRASLADGFERVGIALEELVTSSRTFPTRLRVDVTRALADRLAGAPCMGIFE